MRLAVISDTHLDRPSAWFERVYTRHLAPADALIHCGDITGASLLHYLMQHKNLYAVAGNMDAHWAGSDLPSTLALELEGFRIGVSHGFGSKSGVARRVAEAFGPGYDLICYGHTHVAAVEQYRGVTLLNPGSLEMVHGEPSLAIVTLIKGHDARVELHQIDRHGVLE
jgi:hypothetical protein